MVKKQAPKDMKSKDAIQHCIDGYFVDEILKGLPAGIKIIGCGIRFGMPMKRKKVVVPKKLREVGTLSLNQIQPTLEASIVLDEVNKKQVKHSVQTVADYCGVDAGLAQFDYITLTNGDGTGKFVKCTKEMEAKGEDAADLRKKLKVLGLTVGEGRVQSLVADVNAGAYKCDFQDEIVKRVSLCRRVK